MNLLLFLVLLLVVLNGQEVRLSPRLCRVLLLGVVAAAMLSLVKPVV